MILVKPISHQGSEAAEAGTPVGHTTIKVNVIRDKISHSQGNGTFFLLQITHQSL